MPRRNPETGRLESSVCRSSGLDETALWAICSNHFDRHARVPAIGRGVGPASAIFDQGLSFDADGKPYPQHANIIGWAEEAGRPDSEIKNRWMNQAQTMAKQFVYRARLRTS